ncbi:MAG: HAD family hydrolase [Candidatus Eisenbacteria bacterium]
MDTGFDFRLKPCYDLLLMMLTTVLLDAGGVILDESEHERVRVAIAVEVLNTVIPGYTQAAFYSEINEAIESFCPRILSYVFWKHLKPDRERYDDLYALFQERWREARPALKLMRGFGKEVEAMAGNFDIGIAGQYGKDMLDLLETESLLRFFRYRFTQDDFAITKPDPRYLEQIAEACGVDPRQCIMVGDRVDNDVIPAKQVGMGTVLVRVGLHELQQPRTPFEIPDMEITGITGLAAAVSTVAGMR